MIRAILLPLLALFVGAALYASPTRAAEPLRGAASIRALEVDPIARMLTLFQAHAIFVGRSNGGLGYMLMSEKKAFWVRLAPNGIVRFEPADPAKVKSMVRRQGWTI